MGHTQGRVCQAEETESQRPPREEGAWPTAGMITDPPVVGWARRRVIQKEVEATPWSMDFVPNAMSSHG